MWRKTLVHFLDVACRLGLGALFVYSSWFKLQDPALFAEAVKGYQMLPDILCGYVAIVLPAAELIAGLMLVFTKWAREAALLILLMLLVFLVGLTQAWLRGLDISCGCFGPADGEPVPLWLDIVRDLFLLLPTVWLVIRPNGWPWSGGWIRQTACLAAIFACGAAVGAEDVRPGVWTGNFSAAFERARVEGRPLLVVASAPNCLFCKRAKKALAEREFQDWSRSNAVYLVEAHLAETNASPQQFAAVRFVDETEFKGVRSYPAAAVYRSRRTNEILRTGFTLRRGKMPGKSDRRLPVEIINALNCILSE